MACRYISISRQNIDNRGNLGYWSKRDIEKVRNLRILIFSLIFILILDFQQSNWGLGIKDRFEGNGRRSIKERRRFFDIAIGSATEVSSIFDVAIAYGYISKPIYEELQSSLLQAVRMLYKLKWSSVVIINPWSVIRLCKIRLQPQISFTMKGYHSKIYDSG